MKFKNKNENGFTHPLVIFVIIGAVTVVGLAGWRVANTAMNKNKAISSDASSSFDTKSAAPTAEASIQEKASAAPAEVTVPTPATSKKTTTPAATKPATSSTNCGSPLFSGNNTAFMDSETYISTKKFKAALEFAGLTDIANGNKTVVFTMSDSQFDSLSTDQEAFMNASPDNMKSVLGWHIVQSCQTYADVFKNATAPITLQTLNGPVAYTLSGHGKVENAEIAIWDWFTSNGAVHYIIGFIKPPQV